MRVVIQRVVSATVKVDQRSVGSIEKGFVLLVAFQRSDELSTVKKVATKIAHLRIFSDADDKMNLALDQVGGQVLSIPQFTLYGDVTTGRRPSFTESAAPELADTLFSAFNEELRGLGVKVETGIFQAAMLVELINDGPVTIIVDSEDFK